MHCGVGRGGAVFIHRHRDHPFSSPSVTICAPHLIITSPMSASDQTAGPSANNFTAILNAASTEYHRVTKKRLDTHPFAALLDTCNTPESVSNLFRTQVRALSKFREDDGRLMAWLDPIVHILFIFSGTLGEGIGLVSSQFIVYYYSLTSSSQPFSPAKTVFTGIGVLLGVSLFANPLLRIRVTSSSQAVKDVVASHDTLINLFERVHFFLRRLNSYIGIPLTSGLTELLGMIMAQILSILALSTKAMTERRISELIDSLCSFSAD